MTRTKWMRLLVRDLSEVVRWASSQNARKIDDFRYRHVNGRESVSFRLVPGYAIEVGTTDIVVICHVRASLLQAVRNRAARTGRRLARSLAGIARPPVPALTAGRRGNAMTEAPRMGELRTLPWVQTSSPSAS